MRFITSLVVVITGFAASLNAAAFFQHEKSSEKMPEGPKIRVLLEKDISSALLEAKGKYKVVRKDTNGLLSFGTVGKRFVVHAMGDGIRWGEEYPDVYQISLIPTSPDTVVYVNGIQYKGAISVYHVRDNHITIVNEVSIEDFLKATLTLKFEEPVAKEALSALTIIARTNAYNIVLHGESGSRPWDTTAQEMHYYGHGVTHQRNGVGAAVDWSRFMIIESLKDGEPVTNIRMTLTKARELASVGFDAQRILKTAFPTTKIGVTIKADEVALLH